MASKRHSSLGSRTVTAPAESPRVCGTSTRRYGSGHLPPVLRLRREVSCTEAGGSPLPSAGRRQFLSPLNKLNGFAVEITLCAANVAPVAVFLAATGAFGTGGRSLAPTRTVPPIEPLLCANPRLRS
jgi:hypothetical protein